MLAVLFCACVCQLVEASIERFLFCNCMHSTAYRRLLHGLLAQRCQDLRIAELKQHGPDLRILPVIPALRVTQGRLTPQATVMSLPLGGGPTELNTSDQRG